MDNIVQPLPRRELTDDARTKSELDASKTTRAERTGEKHSSGSSQKPSVYGSLIKKAASRNGGCQSFKFVLSERGPVFEVSELTWVNPITPANPLWQFSGTLIAFACGSRAPIRVAAGSQKAFALQSTGPFPRSTMPFNVRLPESLIYHPWGNSKRRCYLLSKSGHPVKTGI